MLLSIRSSLKIHNLGLHIKETLRISMALAWCPYERRVPCGKDLKKDLELQFMCVCVTILFRFTFYLQYHSYDDVVVICDRIAEDIDPVGSFLSYHS